MSDNTGTERTDSITNPTGPAVLPPGFTRHTCLSVRCGTCRDEFADTEDIGTLHFDNIQEATRILTEAGWWVTTTGVQCATCAARQACDTLGHAWPAWSDCGCGCHRDTPQIPAHTHPMRTRWCDSCQEWQEQPA